MAQDPQPKSEMPIISLLPNVLTLAAICAGLTAIRFGFHGDYARAVLLIVLASVLDGVDGRLARLLKSESKMGAELDSLADFLNFGVAAPLLLYSFALQDMRRAGWIAVLVFSVCCVIRLARFNVQSKEPKTEAASQYFVGIPAPAGAMLAMLPMFVSFLVADGPVVPAELVALWMVIVGFFMISRVPTYSFKILTISRKNVRFFLLGAMVLIAALFSYLWVTLVVLDLVYIAGVLWAWRTYAKKD
ncbi:CDP-diacylglycerol--serine O-phosphatidyltransferase [Yoonia sp.]|uniref:CDP-diacylglycerol--serine O-phosphatidyltransferase n=1 Tax=Yoonia sp. TaxID=2212373 RepID=UPI0025F14472|nr:CDP-diacylglycerol--serine O-phosphatidyltransferase [Yoonia sp.]